MISVENIFIGLPSVVNASLVWPSPFSWTRSPEPVTPIIPKLPQASNIRSDAPKQTLLFDHGRLLNKMTCVLT